VASTDVIDVHSVVFVFDSYRSEYRLSVVHEERKMYQTPY
jgi:hypothetical protein